jgi:hypothetical protein
LAPACDGRLVQGGGSSRRARKSTKDRPDHRESRSLHDLALARHCYAAVRNEPEIPVLPDLYCGK